MARKSLITATVKRAALKRYPTLSRSVVDGITTLTIPADIDVGEIVQALERFAAQRGRAVTRNAASENKAGMAAFKDKQTALIALSACLEGLTVAPSKGRKAATKNEEAATA